MCQVSYCSVVSFSDELSPNSLATINIGAIKLSLQHTVTATTRAYIHTGQKLKEYYIV